MCSLCECEDASLNLKCTCKMLVIAACTCNPHTGELENGNRALELSGQPAKSVKDLKAKQSCEE